MWWVLFRAVFMRNWRTMRRYPFNMLAGIVITYIIFLFIFHGYRMATGAAGARPDVLDAIVVGYLVWLYCVSALSTVTWNVTNEAQMGTLEQLYMNRFGFLAVWFCHMASDLILSLAFVLPMLFAVMLTTGRWLTLGPRALVSLLVVVPLTMASVYGCGLALGGLALLFKQVQAFFSVVQFALVGVLVVPVERAPALVFAPAALGAEMIRNIASPGNPIFLWRFEAWRLATLAANAALWLVFGAAVFRAAVRAARRRGLLAHY